MDKLNIKQIIVFKTPFWKKLAQSIKKWILKDMLSGTVQRYTTAKAKTYSKQYKTYKTNDMRRFSDNKRLGSPRTLKSGITKNYKNNGLQGKSVTQSQTPNMYLTGETINGLDYQNSNNTQMIMSYKPKDAMKILGNEEYGRDIRTLNEANMQKLQKAFLDGLDKNIREWAKKKVVITVGK